MLSTVIKSFSRSTPSLAGAQYRAYSRQMPMMYPILLSSTWIVAYVHTDIAPLWLTVAIPSLFTAACVFRMFHWLKAYETIPSPEEAARAFRATMLLAPIIASSFTVWSFLLFSYGTPYTKSYLAFYVANTVVVCIFCLMHVREAALIVTLIVNGAFIGFFAWAGQPTFLAMALNTALVSIGMLVVLSINYDDFARRIAAEADASAKQAGQARLMRMIDDMPVAVMTADPIDFKITYLNDASRKLLKRIEHLLPIDAEAMIGASIDIFHLVPDRQRRLLSDPTRLPHRIRINLGNEVLDLNASAIHADDGNYLGPMLTWAIVTSEVEAEKKIRYLAHHDALTGLANRVTLNDALLKLTSDALTPGALLLIDLDGFKVINDTLGHKFGDELLVAVAKRLSEPCDRHSAVIARQGGDEFAIVLTNVSASQCDTITSDILTRLSEPFVLERKRVAQIGASIGVALFPKHATSAEEVMVRADMALYVAKAAGKGGVRYFTTEMQDEFVAANRLENELRIALSSGKGLSIFYQPIIDLRHRKVVSREALARWYHDELGWVSPATFIVAAERSDLILKLGHHVLHEACREAMSWDGGETVAVNISASQMGRSELLSVVRSALDQSGLPPERLELEITETALLRNEAASVAELEQIRALGVRISLDDFGTGYSSLAHLRLFPFDKIKIDGSFVRDALDRADCASIVAAVIDLGNRLGVATVAEGVETLAHFNLMQDLGCHQVQGYLVGRPSASPYDDILNPDLVTSS
ncbi:putative bifunctional diguanylate cyclase/phosphodiesterase [Sphingobium yanoikuyae]|uniref:putative bifunctional diguanylate cyclase/phosphodiesterase n=1 Tax=Sphingobium yanoikuyae TaxID=13690 RepID=UPI00241FC081|nr:EAL domain-containing protein [Sphingobium yanoikuyae]